MIILSQLKQKNTRTSGNYTTTLCVVLYNNGGSASCSDSRRCFASWTMLISFFFNYNKQNSKSAPKSALLLNLEPSVAHQSNGFLSASVAKLMPYDCNGNNEEKKLPLNPPVTDPTAQRKSCKTPQTQTHHPLASHAHKILFQEVGSQWVGGGCEVVSAHVCDLWALLLRLLFRHPPVGWMLERRRGWIMNGWCLGLGEATARPARCFKWIGISGAGWEGGGSQQWLYQCVLVGERVVV